MSGRYESGFMMPPATPAERWLETERVIGEIFDGNAIGSTRNGLTLNVEIQSTPGNIHSLQLWRRMSKDGRVLGTRILHEAPNGDEDVYDIYPSGDVIQSIGDIDTQIVRNKRRLASILSHVTLVGLSSYEHETFERIAAFTPLQEDSRINPLYRHDGYNALFQKQLTAAPHSTTND